MYLYTAKWSCEKLNKMPYTLGVCFVALSLFGDECTV